MLVLRPILDFTPRPGQLRPALSAMVLALVLLAPGFIRAEPRMEILERDFVEEVEQAYVRYPSGELMVTGWIFVHPFGEQDVEPCIVFNHGGVGGVNEATRKLCRWMAKQGYIVFAPSYRGEDDSEGEIEVAKGEVDDVVNAVLELRQHPGIQPDRFVLVGTSHGALVSVKAMARPELCNTVQGVVAAYGVMDIYAWYQHLLDNDFDVSDPLSRKVYGYGPEDKPEAFAERHALSLVDSLCESPILFIQGEKDEIVLVQQARTMIDTLRGAGRLQDRIRIYSVGGHGFLYWDDPRKHDQVRLRAAADAWQDIMRFVDECVGEQDDYEG